MGTVTHTTQATGVNDPAKQISKDAWNAGHTFSLDKTDVGLTNVDNTSDASKPVSTATQTALDAKLATATAASTYQPLDSDLTAIAGLDATGGLLAKTAANTYARRTITGTANKVTVTNGDGVSGNPTLTLPDALTLVTPTLGTPASGTLTNCTGLPIAGTTGYGTGVATALAANVNGSGAITLTTSPAFVTPALGTPASGNLSSCTADGTDAVGFRNIPQNAQTGNYTLVLADAGKHIYHAVGAGAGDTYTIPANGSVAYPIGTAITFINDDATNAVTIAITTDTLVLSPGTTTGSRTLATGGVATAIKVTSTRWIISGSGLT